MSSFLEQAAAIVTILEPFSWLLGGSAVGLSAAGLFPKVGPGRALTLAFRSRLFGRPSVSSHRKQDVANLSSALQTLRPNHFIVQTGPKGVGKTTVVKTVTHDWGVVSIRVGPGTTDKEITRDALAAITHTQSVFWLNPAKNARRVLFCYRFFPFLRPLVVIQAAERPRGEKPAQIAAAARELSQDYSLRVLVDASAEAMQVQDFTTKREIVFFLDAMTKQDVISIHEFRQLFSTLDKHNLGGVVWAVIGGNPASLEILASNLSRSVDPLKTAYQFVVMELSRAIVARKNFLVLNPHLEPLLKRFKDEDTIEAGGVEADLKEVLRVRVHPDTGVLRLFPATTAMRFVLKHEVADTPSAEKLAEMAGNDSPSFLISPVS